MGGVFAFHGTWGSLFSQQAPAPAPRFQPSYKRVDMKDMKKAIWTTLSSGRTLVSTKGNEVNKATKVDKGNTEEVNKVGFFCLHLAVNTALLYSLALVQ